MKLFCFLLPPTGETFSTSWAWIILEMSRKQNVLYSSANRMFMHNRVAFVTLLRVMFVFMAFSVCAEYEVLFNAAFCFQRKIATARNSHKVSFSLWRTKPPRTKRRVCIAKWRCSATVLRRRRVCHAEPQTDYSMCRLNAWVDMLVAIVHGWHFLQKNILPLTAHLAHSSGNRAQRNRGVQPWTLGLRCSFYPLYGKYNQFSGRSYVQWNLSMREHLIS